MAGGVPISDSAPSHVTVRGPIAGTMGLMSESTDSSDPALLANWTRNGESSPAFFARNVPPAFGLKYCRKGTYVLSIYLYIRGSRFSQKSANGGQLQMEFLTLIYCTLLYCSRMYKIKVETKLCNFWLTKNKLIQKLFCLK